MTNKELKKKISNILVPIFPDWQREFPRQEKLLVGLFEHALTEEFNRGWSEALDEDFEEMKTRADIAKENYSQGYNDCLKGRKKAPHDTRDSWCCACDYDLSVMEEKIRKARQAVITEIKKKLPTHQGGVLSRNEVKKMLDTLK